MGRVSPFSRLTNLKATGAHLCSLGGLDCQLARLLSMGHLCFGRFQRLPMLHRCFLKHHGKPSAKPD